MFSSIEGHLKELSLRSDQKRNEQRNAILCLALQHKHPSDCHDFTAIFSNTASGSEKQFYCACILRIICACDEAVWEELDFRVKAFKLLDSTLGEVYGTLGVSRDDPNHIKLSKLKDIECSLIDGFSTISNGIISVKTAVESQAKIIKLLVHPFYSLLLEQFSEPGMRVKDDIGNLYGLTREYANAKGNTRLSAFGQLEREFSGMSKKLAKSESILLETTVGEVLRKIFCQVSDDFGKSDLIQPAVVRLIPQNRNYPFHKKDAQIDLRLKLVNEGPGIAKNIRVEALECDGIYTEFNEILSTEMRAGSISFIVNARSNKITATGTKLILFRWSWQNYNNESVVVEDVFNFESQRDDIDWDECSRKRPYSLQAVGNENDLVGRRDLINKLFSNLVSEDIQSAIVFGQKRVGKTSIAKTLESKLLCSDNVYPVFIKTGDLDKTTPSRFIRTLGEAIVEGTKDSNDVLRLRLPDPVFDDVLSPPLARYFRSLYKEIPEQRFIIIIDEFDEIPSELYRYTELGNTFFHNIRALSQEGSQIGFVLVGGENMQIIRQSTDRLNLFSPEKVDYFDKERYFDDFKELILHPAKEILEYSTEAIEAIYKYSEGNPFYTKVICDQIFKGACDRKDSYISLEDTEQAIILAIEGLDIINMNHFWIDGAWGANDVRNDEIQTHRRKFLMAYASLQRNQGRVTHEDFRESPYLQSVPVESLIESFTTRGIIVGESNSLRLKPRLFDQWLTQRGSDLITSTFANEDAIREMQAMADKIYVTDTEINRLVKKWDLYRSSRILNSDVRAWLDQFADNTEKRLMFKLLDGIKFYGEEMTRAKLRYIHKRVREDMRFVVKGDEKRIREILLSSFGKPTKSGSSYARMYASENSVISTNVEDLANLGKFLQSHSTDRVTTILFVDDIIGTGGTVIEGLQKLNLVCGQLLVKRDIRVVAAALCGREDGVASIERYARSELAFKVEVYLPDHINNESLCFSPQSRLFADDVERAKAKEIATRNGIKLQKKIPSWLSRWRIVNRLS